MDTVMCPFCKEEDFDLPGLKLHLDSGACEVWEQTERLMTLWRRPLCSCGITSCDGSNYKGQQEGAGEDEHE